LGLAIGSDFLNYVAANWNLKDSKNAFEFSMDYQINKKESRYSADKADTFAMTMWAYGVSKDLMQNPDNLKTVPQDKDSNWNLPSSE